MPVRSKFILWVMTLGAIACVVIAAWWLIGARREVFYTDGGELRETLPGPAPRDVLWQTPKPVLTIDGDPIEALDAFVSADESSLLLVRETDRGDTDLYRAERRGGRWSVPVPITELNTPDNELDPALSPGGARVYFASDRPGGAGGLDVWVCSWTDVDGQGAVPCAFNSSRDDADPHALTNPVTADDLVLFSSDRASTDALIATPPDARSVYVARDGSASLLIQPDPDQHLLDPAAAPSSDFVYWTVRSSTDELELARARIDASQLEDAPITAEPLGRSINAGQNARSPSITLEGFAIHFIADAEGTPILYRAVSREVYLARNVARNDLLGLIPWILLALAAVILLSMLRMGVRDVRWKSALGTLGLMARCVLASLVLHAALLAILAALHVPEDPGPSQASSTGQVSLSSSGVRSALAGQLRETATEIEITRPDIPVPSTPAGTPAPDRPASVELTPSRSTAIAPAFQRAPVTQADTSTMQASDVPSEALTESLPEVARAAPRLAMPTAVAPTAAGDEQRAAPAVRLADAAVGAPRDSTRLPSSAPSNAPGYQQSSPTQPINTGAGARLSDAAVPGIAMQTSPLETDLAGMPDVGVDVGVPDLALPEASSRGGDARAVEPQRDQESGTLASAAIEVPSASIAGPTHTGATQASPATEFGAVAVPQSTAHGELADAMPADDFAELPEIPAELPDVSLSFDGLTIPEVIDLSHDLTGVVIDDETEEPLQGATVRLDLADEDDVLAESGADGSFGLSFDNVPDNAAVTAVLPGYAPGAVNISSQDIERGGGVVIRLRQLNPNLIVLEDDPEVHHLGDDGFSGRINSQFQRDSEGLTLTLTFTLTDEQTSRPLRGVDLKLLVKGSQLDNPISLNGRRIGTLDGSPRSGAFREQTHPIPSGVLRRGENTIRIRSVDSPGTDHDDFEFVNVRLLLKPAGATAF